MGLQFGGKSLWAIKNIVLVPSSAGMLIAGSPCANLAHSSHSLSSHSGPWDDWRSCLYSVNFPVSTLIAELMECWRASRCLWDGVYPRWLRLGGSGSGRIGATCRYDCSVV